MSAPKTIAVVGGGSAGFTAARTAAQLGARVLFFMGDNADHASLCVNAGCMPSKAMFRPIDEMHHARRRGWWKITPGDADKVLGQIIAWKDREIEVFRQYRQDQIRQSAGPRFEIIRANARLIDPHMIESGDQRYQADAIILATGSVAVLPPVDGLVAVRDQIWTSDEILHNTRLPASLAVIGGGAIGLEFALRYARLGCRTSMVTRSGLLSHFAPAFGERMQTIYENEGLSRNDAVAATPDEVLTV